MTVTILVPVAVGNPKTLFHTLALQSNFPLTGFVSLPIRDMPYQTRCGRAAGPFESSPTETAWKHTQALSRGGFKCLSFSQTRVPSL